MKLVRSSIPGLDGLPVLEYRRRYRAQKRAANRARNLTHDGRPRQRGMWTRYADLDGLPTRERVRARQRRWAARGSATALEMLWQNERAAMGEIAVEEFGSGNTQRRLE